MSSISQQTDQVRTKVLYSEVDPPFNGYLEVLGKVTKLAREILNGSLEAYESEKGFEFNSEYVKELDQTISLRFLELQSSLDVKKVSQENWEQSNNDTIDYMEQNIEDTTSKLRETHSRLQDRIKRVRELYESVGKVNSEAEILLEGNTSLTTTRSEWEKELGQQLTEKLIKQNYLRRAGGSGGEEKYRVYDNFSKGPKELKHINQSIRADISRLSQELISYKSKWLEDANIFTRVTSVLREELAKRDLHVDVDMDEEMEEDDDEDQDNDRYKKQMAIEEAFEENMEDDDIAEVDDDANLEEVELASVNNNEVTPSSTKALPARSSTDDAELL